MMGRCSIILIRLSERGVQLQSHVHKLRKTSNALVFYFPPANQFTLQFLDVILTFLVSRHSTKFTVLIFSSINHVIRSPVHLNLLEPEFYI